jgi:4'-phosphopantetheinyl transferase
MPSAVLHRSMMTELLSPEEHQRWERFRHTGARDAFVIGRGVLRLLLGEYTSVAARRLELKHSPFGKPYLAAAPDRPDVTFNLSHSGTWIVLGFGVNRPIGVDLEFRESRTRVTDLAQRFFTPEELSLILAAGEESRYRAFYDIWVQKEAYLKALGTGLGRSLKAFAVPPAVPGALNLFKGENPAATESEKQKTWLSYCFSVDPAYASALVTSPGLGAIHHYHWFPRAVVRQE